MKGKRKLQARKMIAVFMIVVSVCMFTGGYLIQATSTGEDRTITHFEPLDNEVAFQYLEAGSAESDIYFPDSLKVTFLSEETGGDPEDEDVSDNTLPEGEEEPEKETVSNPDTNGEEGTEEPGEQEPEGEGENEQEPETQEPETQEPETQEPEEQEPEEQEPEGQETEKQDENEQEIPEDVSLTGDLFDAVINFGSVKVYASGLDDDNEDSAVSVSRWVIDEDRSSKSQFLSFDADIGNYYIYVPELTGYKLYDGVSLPYIRVVITESEEAEESIEESAEGTVSEDSLSENTVSENYLEIIEGPLTVVEENAGKGTLDQTGTTIPDGYTGSYDGLGHNALIGEPVYDKGEADGVTYTVSSDGYSGAATGSMPQISDAGTYYITVSVNGIKSFRDKIETKTARIEPISISSCTITVLEPVVELVEGGAKTSVKIAHTSISADFIEGGDYTLTYENNDKAGTATVIITGIGNLVGIVSKTFKVVAYDAPVTLKYNGSTTKEEWYKDDVILTADGYEMCESIKGPFIESLTFTGSGKDITKQVYFRNKSTGQVLGGSPYSVSVNIDRLAPSGVITVSDKTFKNFQYYDKTGLMTKDQLAVTIKGSDETDGSGVSTVTYYLIDKFFEDEETAESKTGKKWITYKSKSKPVLLNNKKTYVYVKVTDVAGNIGYISSQALICDTEAPVVKNAKVTPSYNKVEASVSANDNLSGVAEYYAKVRGAEDSAPKEDTVKDEGQKSEDGTFKFDSLEDGKKYAMYIIAVDKVGNISKLYKKLFTTVINAEKKKQEAKEAADKKAKEAQAKADAEKAAKAAADAQKKKSKYDTASGNELEEEKEETRDGIPYIKDATGGILTGREKTSGWDNILKETSHAGSGDSIIIDMNGAAEVPSKVFLSYAGEDITFTFDMGKDITWKVFGKDIDPTKACDVNFKVRTGSKNIPPDILNDLADIYPHTEITLFHEGDFGFTASLGMNLEAFNKGMYASLFYYNADKKSLDYMLAVEVADDGSISLPISHASDYTIVVKSQALTEPVVKKQTQSVNAVDNLVSPTSNAEMAKLEQTTSSIAFWIYIAAGLVLFSAIGLLMVPSKRLEE